MAKNKFQGRMLYRSKANRMIWGVCGGLGDYFDIDPVIFRMFFILLSFGGGSGVLIYIFLTLLTPTKSR